VIRLLPLLLLLASDGGSPDAGVLTFQPANGLSRILLEAQPTEIIVMAEDGRVSVKLHTDGRVEFGPGFRGDETARRFWKYLGSWSPCAVDGGVR